MKHSSIVTYYQSVRFFHELFEMDCPLLSHPQLRAVLDGVMKQPGRAPVSKPAFLVEDIRSLRSVICLKLDVHLLVWSSILLLFRTLLRVLHVTDSPHCIRRGDVNLQSWGLKSSIHTSKTKGQGSKCLKLPVVKSVSNEFCQVHWIRYLLCHHPLGAHQPLFATKKLPKLTYSMFSRY